MQLHCSLTKEVRKPYQPKLPQINQWLSKSLVKDYTSVNINVSIVSSVRSQELNLQYRGRDYPTNVISLEYPESRDNFALLYGEIIFCDEVIVNEASEQQKDILAHYAHMMVHAMLHLQGFEHQTDLDAAKMEALEAQIMQDLGFPNPY